MALSAGCGKNADPTSKDGGNNQPASIEGEYVIVGGEMWGKAAGKDEIEKDSEAERTFKITNETIEIAIFGKDKEKLKYTVDATKSPAEMDIVMPGKGEKDKKSFGIYKLEGDTLTFFVMGAEEAKDRPKEFKTVDFTKKENEGKPGGAMMITAKKKK